jgi:hypothetical protein
MHFTPRANCSRTLIEKRGLEKRHARYNRANKMNRKRKHLLQTKKKKKVNLLFLFMLYR